MNAADCTTNVVTSTRRTRRGSSLTALVTTVLVVACTNASTTVSPPPAANEADASPDGSVDGGKCCPPESTPRCCMAYGGWTPAGGNCGQACDGMPVAGPGWELTVDDHGCQVWRHPNDDLHGGARGSGTRYCGEGMFDPVDAGLDADASD